MDDMDQEVGEVFLDSDCALLTSLDELSDVSNHFQPPELILERLWLVAEEPVPTVDWVNLKREIN